VVSRAGDAICEVTWLAISRGLCAWTGGDLDLVLETTEWFWGGILLALSGMLFLIEASTRQSGE
jgi:hypothetical protein